ncbi:MAG: FHA domain-containing protein [Lentisphaeria bacterium]|nr:FHA domain-containing protein [Lentisphaeria bacterium]
MSNTSSGYRIKFISGELAGRIFSIPDSGILIGRTRNAGIRPGGSDIAMEHISLLPQKNSVLLHSEGNEGAWVNGKKLFGGKDQLLTPGDDVRIGKELTFILESDEKAVRLNTSSVPDVSEDATEEITEDGTHEKPEDGDCTRYASAAELADLRKYSLHEKRRRRTVLITGFFLFLFIIAGAFFYTELQQENPITWPGEVSGKYNDGEFRTEIEPGGKCLVYYPRCPATIVKTDQNNCEILTALGKNLDVPFHLVFTVNTLPDGFHIRRKESFEQWRKKVSEQNGFAFLDEPRQDFYRPLENGIPYYRIKYTRQDKKIRWQGYASYMRYYDKELVLLREVPANHFWRSDRVLQRFGAFVVAPVMVSRYMEIPEIQMKESSTHLLQRVSLELRKNIAIAVWADLDLMLRTLMIRAYETQDQVLISAVLPLWLEFRDKQQVWYSRNCLAYQTCKASGNMEEMSRIIDECLRRFPSPDDHRHVKIMKNIWTLEDD